MKRLARKSKSIPDVSHLNGPVEVAGQRAEVVIANPSGIRVNGGSFINASGVTLTTGTPVMNSGNLESFRVTQGTVVVEGLGLDTRTADYTTILARAMEVNAGLWAKHLKVVTGANDISADGNTVTATPANAQGPTPRFMLDVAAIGGMYAGHIFLVGTEAGLGVNNAGVLSADAGTSRRSAEMRREFGPGQGSRGRPHPHQHPHRGRPARERAEREHHHAARGAPQRRKQSVGEARARVRRPASQAASTCRTPTGTSAPNDCNNANPSGHAPWPESTLMCPASLSRTNSLPQALA